MQEWFAIPVWMVAPRPSRQVGPSVVATRIFEPPAKATPTAAARSRSQALPGRNAIQSKPTFGHCTPTSMCQQPHPKSTVTVLTQGFPWQLSAYVAETGHVAFGPRGFKHTFAAEQTQFHVVNLLALLHTLTHTHAQKPTHTCMHAHLQSHTHIFHVKVQM